MADGIIQVDPDSTGKKVDTEQLTVGANTVERQRGQIAGALAAEIAAVLNANPTTEYGLVVRNIPSGTQAVSGVQTDALTDTQLRATAVPVSGTFWQATQPVSGTFWQATQPVSGTVTASGPLTDTELRATPVAVSNASLPLPANAATDGPEGTDGAVHGASQAGVRVLGTAAGTDQQIAVDATGNVQVDIVANGTDFATQTTLAAILSGQLAAGHDVTIDNTTGSPANVQIGDGTSQATVRNLAANDALNVAMVDAAGDHVTSFGGGTQYTEADTSAANPTGTAQILLADSTPALEVTDGQDVARRGTRYGAAYTQIVDSSGNFIDTFGGSGGTAQADNSALGQLTGIGCLYDVTPPAITDGNVGMPLMTSGRVLMTDSSATTQPVSGTVTADAGTGPWPVTDNAGALTVDAANDGTLNVQIGDGTETALVTPAGALNVSATGTVTANKGSSWPVTAADSAIPGTEDGFIALGIDDPSGTARSLAVNATGQLEVDIAAQQTGNVDTNTVQLGGTAISMNTGVRDAGTQRVTVATNDSVPVTGTFWQATQPVSGTFWQATQPVSGTVTATVANATQDGIATTGGTTSYKLISAATTNGTLVSAGDHRLYGIYVTNVNASARYLKLYDKLTAPTVGTDTPLNTLLVPGNTNGAGGTLNLMPGAFYDLGLGIGITTGVADADTGAVAADEIVVNLWYK